MALPSDERIRLVGLGDLVHPARCLVCGNGTYQGGYADLGVWYEYEGNMYLCGLCVEQTATLFNMLTSDESAHLVKQANEAITNSEALKAENGILNERLSVFNAAMRAVADSGSWPVVPVSSGTNSVVVERTSGESVAEESVTGDDGAGTESVKRGNGPRNLKRNEAAGRDGILEL